MNWLTKFPPKIRTTIEGFLPRFKTPNNYWMKDPTTGRYVPRKEVEDNWFVIPGSDYHLSIPPKVRMESLFDDKTWVEIATPAKVYDPLNWRDRLRYTQRLKNARQETGSAEAVVLACGKIVGQAVVLAVHDFRFIGGTLGMAAAEMVIKGMREAIKRHTPFIMVTASGGARLQEGIFSLMQLPRTTIARDELREARLPYIVVLTNPTMGGVTASYGMLGDIHIAEPGALIGFAGQRVIESTIRQKLPPGFQSAEYLREHGMIDMVVHRKDLREVLGRLCRLLTIPLAA